MPRLPSAGLLLFRRHDSLEVFLGHMGGPFWSKKDVGAWSIPKGEYGPDEQPFDAACREFSEETGFSPPPGPYLELGTIRQAAGKRVTAWAVEADLDASAIISNTFEVEWPPRSGRTVPFPEVDRAAWFTTERARERIVRGQVDFLDRLLPLLTDPRS